MFTSGTKEYDIILRYALGIESEPAGKSSHIYPADEETGLQKYVNEQLKKRDFSENRQAAHTIR